MPACGENYRVRKGRDPLEVITAIGVAREHGRFLKENAEYHAAKERQSHIEGRIMELKYKLGRRRSSTVLP